MTATWKVSFRWTPGETFRFGEAVPTRVSAARTSSSATAAHSAAALFSEIAIARRSSSKRISTCMWPVTRKPIGGPLLAGVLGEGEDRRLDPLDVGVDVER